MPLNPRQIFYEVDPRRGLPLVSIQCYFAAGAAADPPGKAGLAHLTAEMLRRGTRRFPRHRFLEQLDALGGTIDVVCNKDCVIVRGEVLRANLKRFLDLFLELLTAPAFAEDELRQLKQELIAQMALDREDDSNLLHLAFWPEFYGAEHPYGHAVEGSPASLGALTAADVASFFRQHYTAERLYLAVCGRLAEEALNRSLLPRFGELPSGAPPAAPDLAASPFPEGCRGLLVTRPERAQNQVLLACPGIAAAAKEAIPLQLALTGFGGTFRSRLTREIRDRRGLSYHASASLPDLLGPAPFYLHTFFETGKTAAGLPLLATLLRDFLAEGLSAEELDHARRYLLNSLPFALETPEKKMGLAIANHLLGRPDDFLQRYREGLQSLTLAEVNHSLGALNGRQQLLVLVGEQKKLSYPVLAQAAEYWNYRPFDQL